MLLFLGGTVFISVPECGIDGHAQVLAIEPCPEILPGDGRVISGTFRHQVSASISLSIAGQQEPILCLNTNDVSSIDHSLSTLQRLAAHEKGRIAKCGGSSLF